MHQFLPVGSHQSGRAYLRLASAPVRSLGPGLALTGAIALAAVGLEAVETTLTRHWPFEALILAILLGVLIRNLLKLPDGVAPGVTFAVKALLESGFSSSSVPASMSPE